MCLCYFVKSQERERQRNCFLPVKHVDVLGSHLRGRPGFLFLTHVLVGVSLLSVSDSEWKERTKI